AAGAYVCNAEAGRILRRKGLRPPVQLIGLGVDVDLFSPGARTQPQTPLQVGYVGRLEDHKGVQVLLGAMAGAEQLPEWELRIAGDGPRRAELEGLAQRLGIADRVRFEGHL